MSSPHSSSTQKTGFCLPLSIYRHTFQPFFSLVIFFNYYLFVCYPSQMKRCFFSKPASPPMSRSFHKGQHQGLSNSGGWVGVLVVSEGRTHVHEERCERRPRARLHGVPPPLLLLDCVGKTQRRGLLLSFPSSLHKFYSSSRDAPHKGRTLRSRTEGGDESTQPTFVSP